MNVSKSVSSEWCKKFKQRLSYFLNYGNISGIRFLGERCEIAGRIFWGIAIFISFMGMLKILNLTWTRSSSSINIALDTAYLHWKSTFPAVSVCLVKGRSTKKLNKAIEKYNISYEGLDSGYLRAVHNYIFTNPNTMNILTDECKDLNSTCGINVEIFQNEFLPHSCKEIMTDVKFNGKSYENCEKIFKFHKTEMGHCFIANSITDYNLDIKNIPLTFDRETEDRSLHFTQIADKFWSYALYIHSPEDLPYFNTPSSLLASDSMIFSYMIEEIVNEDGLKDVEVNQRGCRFPDEKLPGSTHHYSFSTCMSDLRVRVEHQICNCTLFTSPKKYNETYCGVKGMVCLLNANISKMVKKQHYGDESACIPSCIEQRLSVIGENRFANEDIKDKVIIEILNLPTVRYSREVGQTKLDLVVAIGGVVGLFFGASILNIIEICYIWLIRNF